MSENNLPDQIEFAAAGEGTLIAFFEQMASEVGDAHHEILNELARALTERGWVQPIDQIVKKLAEHLGEDKVNGALAELERRRLVKLARGDNRFVGILGCLSVGRTIHRAHLSTGVDVFTFGGFDQLTLNHTLLKDLDVFTTCANSGQEIHLKIAGDQIVDSNINGIAGFIANWDGKQALEEVAANSNLFASDADLEAWQEKHPEVDGMGLPADLFLWVGMSAAQELGGARFKLIGHSE
ncbi:MAG: hypothetical protein CVU56_05645 [Deltaproteobacteria bacterium HGW-Deltaproteobacteria-14]|jgi:hypothetical protein|nr:MAG: hypothetical protein CVU56_05645 [Deltaproteobacteria bacterium HGW-Deltaproteobacteria-14]